MNKKRGFTLIELIAVLVILAIIALITIPIVLRIIRSARDSANKRSIDAFGRTVEYTMALYALNNKGEFPEACNDYECYTNTYDTNGNIIGKISEPIEYAGSTVTGCSININTNTCIVVSNCKVNGRRVNYTFNRCVNTH